MKRIARWSLGVLALCAAAIAWHAWPRTEFIPTRGPAAWASTPDNVARGAYLARAGDCVACHTARGGVPYAGGRSIATPFGELVAPNITPDRESGIGAWSADDFWNALHNGRGRDGRLLYPAFPYTNYTKVARDDADALFAYLRSLAPQRRPNEAHRLRFPYDQQWALASWRLLYFTPGVMAPAAGKSADWQRGAYLVEGLGHCGACHSARNALGSTSGALSGGLIPTVGWYAPSLTASSEAGLGGWDTRHIVQLLRTGVAPEGAVFGPMTEVVANSLQYLSGADVAAMAVYLKSLPSTGGAREPAPAPDAATMTLGRTLYEHHCAECHGKDGRGANDTHGGIAYPPLAGNRALTMDQPVNAIRIVLNGGFPPATGGNPRPYGMPPFSPVLDDADVAAVVTYVRASWGNGARAVTAPDVNRYRAVPLD
jgi:mono/diheme cytochrome c family protein